MEIEKRCPVTPDRKPARRIPKPTRKNIRKLEAQQFQQVKMNQPGPVLIVDDSVEVCQLLRLYLEINGLNVVTASGGQEALAHLLQNEQKPALIILDLSMPKMDGREFLHHKNRHHQLAEIPVLVYSGVPKKEDLQGVQAWAKKSGNIKTLLELVETYVHPLEV